MSNQTQKYAYTNMNCSVKFNKAEFITTNKKSPEKEKDMLQVTKRKVQVAKEHHDSSDCSNDPNQTDCDSSRKPTRSHRRSKSRSSSTVYGSARSNSNF
jgi:hypothetical protein